MLGEVGFVSGHPGRCGRVLGPRVSLNPECDWFLSRTAKKIWILTGFLLFCFFWVRP